MAAMGPDKHLRADAERNRQRVIAAARQVFADEGLGVSMRYIAKRAVSSRGASLLTGN
ncbi:hypothetical protein ACFV1F_04820 [Streptomyces sp. NPDC059590]|uniref:hypothetical protein n=1 Tax=unclassified Streptomyces TaxID=2593676 RepID=UPI0036D1E5FB